VDRERVRLVYAGAAEAEVVRRLLRAFRASLATLGRARAEGAIDLVASCERDETEVGA
jgi:hypothetical protein